MLQLGESARDPEVYPFEVFSTRPAPLARALGKRVCRIKRVCRLFFFPPDKIIRYKEYTFPTRSLHGKNNVCYLDRVLGSVLYLDAIRNTFDKLVTFRLW